MSKQMTLWGIPNATSSRVSEAGPMLCDSQDGPTTDQSGPEAAPVSHSATQESVREPQMSDTCGLSLRGSLDTASLSMFLGSKLRQRLEGIGSPLYELTWKEWAMQSGPPICALRASARRTSDKDCGGGGYSGWTTASARDWKDTAGMECEAVNPDGTERRRIDQLPRQAAQCGWVADAQRTRPSPGISTAKGRHERDAEELGNSSGRCAGRAEGESQHESMEPRLSPYNEVWRDADWLYGRDGRWRPVRSGTFPLGHGLPARVVRLRGYGNAIVPQVAQAFIEAFCEAVGESK
jgi:hypothetical protein